jgi:hypothetical protein
MPMLAASVAAALAVLAFTGQPAPSATPAAAVEALLAADRAASAHAATTTLVDGLTAMFAADVIVPGPPSRLYRGLAEVTALLRGTPDADGRATWTPVGGGISADGQHGFTFGFMTVTRPGSAATPLKYMAYWVKGAQGWRVAGYKRARRPEGDASMAMMAPLVPAALVAPRTDADWLERQRASLAAAERAFSDEAQQIGLGPAFAKFGAPAAVNMGGPSTPSYVVGNEAIGAQIGAGAPGPGSPVEWSTDIALVASSGDLGVSFGFIRPHAKAADGAAQPGAPFFTIWTRAGPDAPWRYIAE